MNALLKILHFLSLIDNDNKLSITSIAIYSILFKLVMAPNPGLTDVGALLLVLLNYAHKRQVNTVAAASAAETVQTAVAQTDATAKLLEELQSKVNAIAIKTGLTR